MKFSDQWLREWVNPPIGAVELGDRLTMAGLELDGIESAAPPFENVVVGRVAAVVPHPDADKLRVCQVEDGSGEAAQVVCGASNVREGMLVPFARLGALLPGDFKIKKAKLRGVESFGMLCSARELGLAESSEGLMPLPSDAPLGADLRDYLGLDDQILEVDLTPNRADCLSIMGVARETAVLTGAALADDAAKRVAPVTETRHDIEIQAPDACPRYVGRVIEEVDPAATTPLWMQERLRRCGIRSLGPIVDVTNYVLLELGQPMHAFDLAKLQGGVRVRKAAAGETLVLLDGQSVELDEETLVIADARGPVAMAGIMGGEATAVGADTIDIFLESAFFAPSAIAGRARRYGLHTDSSHRFERGVDPQLQVRAVERATALLLEIVGGRPGPVEERFDAGHIPTQGAIVLRETRIERLLGIALDSSEVSSILMRLGCEVEIVDGGWRVVPPSFRFDLGIEADLIEELARVHGYDNLPRTSRSFSPRVELREEARLPVARIRDLFVDRGYREAITYSFVEPAAQALITPGIEALPLANPLSADLAVMRTSLWPGLIKAARHNLNRQQGRVRLFEMGMVFEPGPEGLLQQDRLACLIAGSRWPEQWGESRQAADFFDLKGDIEALFALTGLDKALDVRSAKHAALHPGQCGAVFLGERQVGWIGALHPQVQDRLDLGARVYLCELELDAIRQGFVPKFSELSRFPAIRRDLSLEVEEAVSAADIKGCLNGLEIPQLREFYLFDVYRGEGVPNGRKSFALGLILQDLSRTLTDKEVEEIIQHTIARLGRDVGATLRV